ncbi:C-type lectin domain family 4 member F-like [Poecile atricapillus]|uniref:C-type lectin domain family 4 member F-like n=1 Tax=Poecile atricapillus TaxID=48891 RepID=UPI002738FFDB|nr:C-type lectin domain family 4 member F-like [Poecile atricapillus]XP_058693713.1 C-type lectin domain family 4 member F-like [Poecile atricapillus]
MPDSPDLYETLEIRYPPPRAPGDPRPALPPPPARSPRCPGCRRALGTAALLLLAVALAALGTLYVQGRGELRAARAELAAATDPLGPDSDGDSPSAAQRRQDRLGRWLQGLALGWRYHRGKIYLFSGQRQPWAAAEAACAVTHAHLASVTSAEEQAYLAREARGGTYWIGLAATGPGGSWRWADGTPYSPEHSFWAPGQPDSTDHGRWGGESCAQIHPVGAGLWNDHNCNFSFPWVCQRELSAP